MNAVKRLQEHGIKLSVQRIAIMEYLINNRTHPTVDEIFHNLHDKIPTLSKTTVYNTLKLLSSHGAVQTLTIDDRFTCYDADTSAHAHFICRKCNKVYDINFNDSIKIVHPEDNPGFVIEASHYYFRGLCPSCK